MAKQETAAHHRRRLRFSNFDAVILDAQQCHAGGYVPLGNWTLGQAVKHLGSAMHASIDGVEFPASWYLRFFGRLIVRPVILHWQFPPGAKLPKPAERVLVPHTETDFQEGVQVLRDGIERLAHESRRMAHPVIGRLSVEQWDRFHLRHAELHLSFFVPPPLP